MPQVIVVDCGSTNIRAIVVDEQGRVVASAGRSNEAVPQAGQPRGYIIWEVAEVWDKICAVCREVAAAAGEVQALTLTTWGADGAPVRADDSLAYPVICWQDTRTEELARQIGDYADPARIYEITGYQVIPFNTLLRLMWLRQQVPAVMENTQWLMMAGLLSLMLTGERSIEPTGAGTMMAMDMAARDWSPEMLQLAGVDRSFFPRWVEPGEVIGQLRAEAAAQTGLPVGLPVVAAGHDTQFAAIGSGARPGEAILSSGTWEILMLREPRFQATTQSRADGVITEADAVAGYYNPQLLMMGSAVLEWLRDYFYHDLEAGEAAYETLATEAAQAGAGAGGVALLPSFVAATGPAKRYHTHGTLLGLTITSDRGQIYRAALEGLTFQMRHALEALQNSCDTRASLIRVVGGGSKNALWNQLRADVTGLPVATIEQKEATVLGAAMFAFHGTGHFDTLEEAQQALAGGAQIVEPAADQALYEGLYVRYHAALQALEGYYSP